MKQSITVLVAICMILSMFAGCSNSTNTATSTHPVVETVSPTERVLSTESTSTTEAQGIEVDEGLIFVDITLPNWFLEGEDMSTFDPAAYAQENEFKKAVLNGDGSLTVTLSKAKHRELVEETAASLETSFAEYVEGADTPYIRSITHSDDFKNVTISVVRADYENSFDITPFSIGIGVMMYQSIAGTDFHTEISVVDVDTEDVIDIAVYPDNLQ